MGFAVEMALKIVGVVNLLLTEGAVIRKGIIRELGKMVVCMKVFLKVARYSSTKLTGFARVGRTKFQLIS